MCTEHLEQTGRFAARWCETGSASVYMSRAKAALTFFRYLFCSDLHHNSYLQSLQQVKAEHGHVYVAFNCISAGVYEHCIL